jgi:transposase
LDTNFWGFFMTKYDEQFKLNVVQQYLGGKGGIKSIAKRYGLAHAMVGRWIESFRAHGTDGLNKKFSHYSAGFKLSVLQHLWDNELSYGQAAVQFNIRNPSILSTWERSYRSGGLEALQPRPRGRPRKMEAPPIKPETGPDDEKRSREDLVAELNHLRMENAYLKKLRALIQAKQKATPPKKRK